MSEETEKKDIKLTGKQKLFADYYVGEAALNATRAASLAGYKGDYNTLAVTGSENLRKPNIRAYIDAKLKPLIASPNEILTILTRQAKGSLADVLDDNCEFDMKDAKRRGVDVLMKEIEVKETVKKDAGGIQILERNFKYKIHDSQSAADKLGKYHKLFTEKHEHTGKDGEPLFPKVYAGFDPDKV
jgi:phage terminase small subunit